MDAAAAQTASAEQQQPAQAPAAAVTWPCSLLTVAGEPLAELPVEAEWTAGVLAQKVALLAPLADPRRMHYAFVLDTAKLGAEDALAPHLSEGEGLTLTAVVEMVPWYLSTVAKGQSATMLYEEGSEHPVAARRNGGRSGAVVMSNHPVPWLEAATTGGEGAFSFEVVVDGMESRGHEGLELGVTTLPPEDATSSFSDYAVLCQNTWVSSDAGRLWVNGDTKDDMRPQYWSSTTPNKLKVGDVVRFSVLEAGDIEIQVNGEEQVLWRPAGVPASEPLYAIVGMRAPCSAVTVRLPGAVA